MKRGSTTASASSTPTAKQLLLPPSEAELRLLSDFDLRSKYGAVAGISRLVRWRRSERTGLQPPPEVGAILMKYSSDIQVQTSVYDEPLGRTALQLKPRNAGSDE